MDVLVMIRGNVPLNAAFDRWSPADPPTDWEAQRSRWLVVYAVRQVALLLGFLSLLVGAVFRG